MKPTNLTTLYEHRIRIYRKPVKWSFNRDEVTIQQKPILAHNDKYLVLNDIHFTKLEWQGDGVLYSAIDKPSIHFKDVLNEQGIFYSLYSPSKRRISTIEREIRARAEAQYGWLFSSELDLSALTKESDAA
jgi:hypothetical protein